MGKLSSRKFWLALGGSAAGVGTLITGISIPNETATIVLSIVGVCLTAVSIVAYNFAEAYVDAKAAQSSQTLVTETVTTSTAVNATTSSATTADKVLAATKGMDKMDETIKVGGTD